MSNDALFSEIHDDAADRGRTDASGTRIAQRVFRDLCLTQRAAVRDPAKFKSLLVPRRGGKSWCAFAASVILSVQKPGTIWPFLALTFGSAKQIYWDIIQEFNRRYGLGLKLNSNDGSWVYPNGSRGFLRGVASREELDKLRGFETDGITVDECGALAPSVLDELIYKILLPLCISRDSCIWIAGTPGPILEGAFYRSTSPHLLDDNEDDPQPYCRLWADRDKPEWVGREPRWSFHRWTIQDNTAMPHQWRGALQLKKLNNWADDHPFWRAEYLGEWIANDDALVYALGRVRRSGKPVFWEPDYVENPVVGLDKTKQWRFLLGIDFGFEDDTAFVVAAYQPEDPCLYQVYDFKAPHMMTDDVIGEIERLRHLFGEFDTIVVDSKGKQFVESLAYKGGYSFTPAEQTDKYGFIELLNSDIHTGLIRFLEDGNLAREMETLQWDLSLHGKKELARRGRLVEHPKMANHLCDAFLYLWRYSYHAFGRAKQVDLRSAEELWHEKDRLDAIRAAQARDGLLGLDIDPYDAQQESVMTAESLGYSDI